MLHGVGESAVGWQPIHQALSDNYDVIAFDLPGFGRSPALLPGIAPTAAALADAIERDLDRLGVAPFHVAVFPLCPGRPRPPPGRTLRSTSAPTGWTRRWNDPPSGALDEWRTLSAARPHRPPRGRTGSPDGRVFAWIVAVPCICPVSWSALLDFHMLRVIGDRAASMVYVRRALAHHLPGLPPEEPPTRCEHATPGSSLLSAPQSMAPRSRHVPSLMIRGLSPRSCCGSSRQPPRTGDATERCQQHLLSRRTHRRPRYRRHSRSRPDVATRPREALDGVCRAGQASP